MSVLPEGTADRWAFDFITSTDLAHKTAPPSPPRRFISSREPLRIDAPGRPRELTVTMRASKSPGPEALRKPERRAAIVHSFWHHELQAAELMAWAILAFPSSPLAFRRGLLAIALDEIRHMNLYAGYLARLGFAIGSFPVRDWFWQRVPSAKTPAELVAVLGIGFEGGNLDHAARFAARLRHVGDDEGAELEELIAKEEIPHVRFAARWFRRFTDIAADDDLFDAWRAHLPPPLSPMVMRGRPINVLSRSTAGLPAPFIEALERWTAT